MSRTRITGSVEGTNERTGEYECRDVWFYAESNWAWTEVVDAAIEKAFPESGWAYHYDNLEETEVPA